MHSKKHSQELKIDPEFERLHLPVNDKTMERLEKNISTHGAYRPITVWNGFIIDGHKHYRICKKYGIEFTIREMIFESRNAVIIWLCDKNLARCDIPFEYRRYFIGKKFLACYASANGYERDDELQYTSRYKNKKYMIASDVGSEYERSSITIMKYGRFVLAMDEIFRKDPVFAQKILTGEIKIPRESETVISQMSAEEIIMIREYLNEKGGNKITIPEIRRIQNLYRPKPVALENPGFRSIKPEIKNMPKYDPDAETMSLALTIPSWKSSIERVRDKADFACTSEKARNKLLRQLSILSDTIEELSSYIEEAVNEHGNRNGP